MSLFPIRLKPGGTLTVHLRLMVTFPMWVQRRDYLVDPNQNRKLCYEKLLAFLPGPNQPEHDEKLIEDADQIFGGAPLLMAARWLANDFKRTDHFIDMLEGLRDSTHHFYTLTLPEDAALGRYHFELEDYSNGRKWGSGTSDSDYFLVEQLHLVKVEGRGANSVAYIDNPSPEPVLAQLCQFDSDRNSTWGYEAPLITLPPKTISSIPFRGSASLLYRDGDEFLRLTQEKEGSCLRNPAMRMLDKQDCVYVFDITQANDKGFELSGTSLEIWELANGFFPRSVVRTPANASIYDEMVQLGIILELE